jgi:prepilin-type N-terminal cleavage/methylation domain-containing protein
MVMKRNGFSLVELVVVIFIAAVLTGMVLPTVRSAQLAGEDRQTVNNLKQMNLSLHNCNDVYKRLPSAFDKFGQVKYPTSVHVHLMPFIEAHQIYRTFLEEGKGDTKAKVGVFISPIDPSTGKKETEGIQNLAANLRVFADSGVKTKYNENMAALKAVEPGSASIRTFRDGTSNTMVFATKYGYCGKDGGSRYAAAPNTKYAAFFGQNAATKKADPADPKATFQLFPDAKQCLNSPLMAQSFTKKALLIGLADGSVRSVTSQLSAETWNRAMQPNDGLAMGADW